MFVPEPSPQVPQVVAVASGKGGVGKSLLAANLGGFLAALGRRVVLVDGSLGAPNLHVFAGVPRPPRGLGQLLADPALTIDDVAVGTPVPGMRLVAGSIDPGWVANARPSMIARLTAALRRVEADWVIVDLAGGMAPWLLDLYLAADLGVLVAVPDPTSVELMQRFVRAAFVQRLRRLGLGDLARPAAEVRTPEGGLPAPLDLYLRAMALRDDRLGALRRAVLGFAPQIVVSAVRSKADMEIGRALAGAGRRRLGVPLQYLGHLEYDEAVWASTRRRRPLLVEHPEARITKNLEKVSRALMAVRPPSTDGEVLPSDVHYDLLEVAPTASFEDIRRANRRIRDIYGAESVAISGLYEPAGLEAVHRRLDLAYTTLMDAAKRKDYDLELFPEGVPLPPAPATAEPVVVRAPPPAPGAVPAPAPERPPMPAVGPRTEFTGPLLRQVREALGIELREITERTKIGLAYLVSLEEEQFARLPAPVYVRGFLGEYARVLGLDGRRVLETYLERYRAARGAASEEDR
jgi:flagellar biosynthesis protein FlhG